MRAYIGHTFTIRHYVKDEIIPKLMEIGIETINPFYNKDGTTNREEVQIADELDKEGINPRDTRRWVNMVRKRNINIVESDLQMIDQSDVLIAILNDWSCGTIMEIAYMGIFKQKPVYVITQNQYISSHPWILYATRNGKVVKTIEELVKLLRGLSNEM